LTIIGFFYTLFTSGFLIEVVFYFSEIGTGAAATTGFKAIATGDAWAGKVSGGVAGF